MRHVRARRTPGEFTAASLPLLQCLIHSVIIELRSAVGESTVITVGSTARAVLSRGWSSSWIASAVFFWFKENGTGYSFAGTDKLYFSVICLI